MIRRAPLTGFDEVLGELGRRTLVRGCQRTRCQSQLVDTDVWRPKAAAAPRPRGEEQRELETARVRTSWEPGAGRGRWSTECADSARRSVCPGESGMRLFLGLPGLGRCGKFPPKTWGLEKAQRLSSVTH